MNHSTEITSGVANIFYKAPLPLIIGNLPFSSDFKENKDEYNYLDYYIVPQQNNILGGVLFYSEFFKDYQFIEGKYASWQWMYPFFNIPNNSTGTSYHLNPFVNDVNGCCSWIAGYQDPNTNLYPPGIGNQASFYFNFTSNKYEFGFGEDVWTYNKCYFHLPSFSLYHGYSFSYNPISVSSSNELKNLSLVGKNFKIGWQHEVMDDPSISIQMNWDDLSDENNLSKTFYTRCSNKSLDDTLDPKIYHCSFDLFNHTKGSPSNFIYNKLNILKDLDYEDDPASFNNMLGVYENNNENNLKNFLLGNIVIGDETNRDEGWFIGVNNINTNLININNIDNSYLTTTFIESNNFIPVSKSKKIIGGKKYEVNLENFNFIINFGYTWKNEVKKHLVYYLTTDDTGIFRKNRIFIIESSPGNLLNQRKFWYADLPDVEVSLSTFPKLFQLPFTLGETTFNELVFNYVNLDDEADIKDTLTFKVLGLCRENSTYNLFGIQIPKSYFQNNHEKLNQQTNVYIGYWQCPMTNEIEE